MVSSQKQLLVIGRGGREHALAWLLARSANTRVYVAPGNAGTAGEPNVTNIPLTKIPDLVAFAQKHPLLLTVVGPEAPLAEGIVDQFRAADLPIFGPTQFCARLESSKAFAKAFMERHSIPTAPYAVFSDPSAAHAYVEQHCPVVIKADGLAAGKGVTVAMTSDQAHDAIDVWLGSTAPRSDAAPPQVVIESFIEGTELSFIAMVDGENILPLATSQDHKRLLEGDLGPNTGGMGAYSPVPMVSPALHEKIMQTVIIPAVQGMAKENTPYTGFLYAGLMVKPDGSLVTLEFNCRLGDPEAQVILPRIRSDFVHLLDTALSGKLHSASVEWDPRPALGIVIATANYPQAQGPVLLPLPAAGYGTTQDNCFLFHSGTQRQGQQVFAQGGRTFCATALSHSISEARQLALKIVETVAFPGCQYRRDIGIHA